MPELLYFAAGAAVMFLGVILGGTLHDKKNKGEQ